MAGPRSVDEWLTELEIKSLLVRERYYRDTAQWQKLRESYHPEASKTHINISWCEGDIDAFVSGSEKMATSGGAHTTHTISPAVIHYSTSPNIPPRAVSESPCSILIRFTYADVSYDLTSYARLISRLELASGVWKLLTLEAIYEKDTIVPSFPSSSTGTETTSISLDETARASYRGLTWLLGLGGRYRVSQELPGSDRPGSGEALVEGHLRWLSGSEV
ncbi:hypothetical protein HD806DRAFT_169385 [Xylariaceae sp. AK1471]|nr:hypothetical protein HD806DRAFT_169385 [Xylariaceae sp. AK1471]